MRRYGRQFVAFASDTDELSKFTGQPVQQPIRVYTGMNSGSYEERAELAEGEADCGPFSPKGMKRKQIVRTCDIG